MKKFICLFLSVALVTGSFSGCGKTTKKADFSGVNSVCELATLKCYYHNVARLEKSANGLLAFMGAGYKKIWTEYYGIVDVGIDMNKVSVSEPDSDNVVKVTIPDAKVLDVKLESNSIKEPLTEKGWFTSISGNEKTQAIAEAQKSMEEAAKSDESLLAQGKQRAKSIIEGYIKNVGKQMGEEYTIEWKDAKEDE